MVSLAMSLAQTCSHAEVDQVKSSKYSTSDVGFHVPNSRVWICFPSGRCASVTFDINPLVSFSCPIESRPTYSTFRNLEREGAVELESALSERVIVRGADNVFEQGFLSSLDVMNKRADIYIRFTVGISNR